MSLGPHLWIVHTNLVLSGAQETLKIILPNQGPFWWFGSVVYNSHPHTPLLFRRAGRIARRVFLSFTTVFVLHLSCACPTSADGPFHEPETWSFPYWKKPTDQSTSSCPLNGPIFFSFFFASRVLRYYRCILWSMCNMSTVGWKLRWWRWCKLT